MTSVPFELRVLGPVTVRAASDPAEHSRLTQPRHLAVLCYLALARPRGLHARDTLMALLWPEHDAASGRRALRNALYSVRRALGSAAIVSAGDHLIGLDPARVACDAVRLERGQWHDAPPSGAPLSGAPPSDAPEPLQGLHVDGSAGFDRWMSIERARLARLLAKQGGRRRPATAPVLRGAKPSRPHAQDAAAMYTRGHFLFLRSAHGGPASELLRARDYFERAHTLDPQFAPAVAGLANFYAVAARRSVLTPFATTFARAISLSEQALAMDATLAVPHVHFAVQALYLDDDWERAGLEFETAVAKDPEYAEAHRFYGVWLGLVGRTAEALREMEEAARLEPDIPMLLSSLAAARLAVGDRRGGEDALRRTLAIEPTHAAARDRLVRMLDEEERTEEALAERERAPALRGAADLRAAWDRGGRAAYTQTRVQLIRDEIALLEARMVEQHPLGVADIFSPPVVRLVALCVRIGDEARARRWELQGSAARPALKHWCAAARRGEQPQPVASTSRNR